MKRLEVLCTFDDLCTWKHMHVRVYSIYFICLAPIHNLKALDIESKEVKRSPIQLYSNSL